MTRIAPAKREKRKHWNYTGPSQQCAWWTSEEGRCEKGPTWLFAGDGVCNDHSIRLEIMWNKRLDYYNEQSGER